MPNWLPLLLGLLNAGTRQAGKGNGVGLESLFRSVQGNPMKLMQNRDFRDVYLAGNMLGAFGSR